MLPSVGMVARIAVGLRYILNRRINSCPGHAMSVFILTTKNKPSVDEDCGVLTGFSKGTESFNDQSG